MLDRQSYFIREHVGLLKLTETYDILDPATKQQIGIAKEKASHLMQLLRLVVEKRYLPMRVSVYEGTDSKDESKLLFSIRRGFTFLRAKVDVLNSQGTVVGFFKRKLLSIGGAFYVHDAAGNQVAFVKGDWKGWNFKFTDESDNEIGVITKKWMGIGKELFTSADNYILTLSGTPSPATAMLLLAAGLAVDTVFKER